jgi:hypothetical protein
MINLRDKFQYVSGPKQYTILRRFAPARHSQRASGGARALLARRVHGAPQAASMEDSWKPRLARVLLTLCSTRLTGPFV